MAGYAPLHISGPTTGLVQNRQQFILPNDAFPVLVNAHIYREQIRRKYGTSLLGRLQIVGALISIGNFSNSNPALFSGNFLESIQIENPTATISPGSVFITTTPISTTYNFQDLNQDGMLVVNGVFPNTFYEPITNIIRGTTTQIFFFSANVYQPGYVIYLSGINGTTALNGVYATVVSITSGSVIVSINSSDPLIYFPYLNGGTIQFVVGSINYNTGALSLSADSGFSGAALSASFNYNPNLPVMGICGQQLNGTSVQNTIIFDTMYAYIYNSVLPGFEQFIAGTTWTGTDYNFFWSTNWWQTPFPDNKRLFWVTNFSGTGGDPIRYTDGTTWTNFAPQINAAGDLLNQCLALAPFRSRLLTFNTLEGPNLIGSGPFPQRIRWSAIGNPFSTNSWRSDIRGQGGFLDIPTTEPITSIAFVRDNLIVFTEHSTWQLRYTGRSIAPFQIERVNSELGCESTFSSVQFDTSVVAIGDKGIIECDSYKADRIDIKIPDLVFTFNSDNEGPQRVAGIRDFFQKLAYWIYPSASAEQGLGLKYPDRRLVYNYENDSWAIFIDTFTALGKFQIDDSPTWANTDKTWNQYVSSWISRPDLFPNIIAGNQQGYVSYLDTTIDNDVSLYISNIQGMSPNPTVLVVVNHNLLTGSIVKVLIPPTQNYGDLNGGIFQVNYIDQNTFYLTVYDPTTGQFSLPQLDSSQSYVGGAQLAVVDNFKIQSKKFNFLDEGENIQLGYLDILMDNTENGAINLNVYVDYNTTQPTNTYPENDNPSTNMPDPCFNSTVPTNATYYRGTSKNWQRVVCPTQGAFITLEWTLSNAQIIGVEQACDVQIDSQILWIRKSGKHLAVGY